MTCSFMQLAMLQYETQLQKHIRMGIRQSRNTSFQTVYPTIYLPKRKVWIQLSPQCFFFKNGNHRSRTSWGIENKYFFAKPNFITKLSSKPSPINFVEIDHEIFSTVILHLLLIQEGLLSVTSKVCVQSVSVTNKSVCTEMTYATFHLGHHCFPKESLVYKKLFFSER